ncbi:MAG TPA: T9SS type A sorting domain-containing protein, partial [Flavobacterium sp.]|nr:T9SS type A sorting domain-containing protein [Flavobacterium sp.]
NNNNYTLAGVFKDGSTTSPENINWVSGYNGNATPPISLARYWLFKFQNGTEYADWMHFVETDEMRPSQGFTLKGPDALTTTQNYTFVGKPYNGLIDGNSVLPDNLFLVGNPYPSAIDAFSFIKDNISVANGGNNTVNVIDGTLYFWHHSPTNNTHNLGEYTGGYATLNLAGGVDPIAPVVSAAPVAPVEISGVGTSNKMPYQYIPVGQGFFVNGDVNSLTSAKIIFNNNQRAFVKEDGVDDQSAPISNTLFRNSIKNNKSKPADHFADNSNDPVYNNYNTKIRLGFESANNFHRQLLIGFMNENATDGVDIGYDGHQIDTQSNDLYFLINNSEYTIQGVGEFDVNKAYPLGVKTGISGLVKFKIDGTEFLPSSQKIYVHDKETSIYHDITHTAAEVSLEAGIYNSRFELTFKTTNSLGTRENNLPESMLLVYNNDPEKTLKITKNQSFTISEVSIYNINGQRLVNLTKIPEHNTIEIPFNVQRGTYVVKIITDKGVLSRKVLKQ